MRFRSPLLIPPIGLISALEQSYFVKLNRADRAVMFAAEAAGLAELGQAVGLRIPHVITQGSTEAHAYLVLEYIALEALTPAAMTISHTWRAFARRASGRQSGLSLLG